MNGKNRDKFDIYSDPRLRQIIAEWESMSPIKRWYLHKIVQWYNFRRKWHIRFVDFRLFAVLAAAAWLVLVLNLGMDLSAIGLQLAGWGSIGAVLFLRELLFS